MVSSDAPRKRLFLCCCEAGASCVASAKRSVSPHGGEASASREKTHFPLAFSRLRCILYITLFLCFSGEMAERSKAAVSKTVNGISPFGGSNPPLSANPIPDALPPSISPRSYLGHVCLHVSVSGHPASSNRVSVPLISPKENSRPGISGNRLSYARAVRTARRLRRLRRRICGSVSARS